MGRVFLMFMPNLSCRVHDREGDVMANNARTWEETSRDEARRSSSRSYMIIIVALVFVVIVSSAVLYFNIIGGAGGGTPRSSLPPAGGGGYGSSLNGSQGAGQSGSGNVPPSFPDVGQ